MITKEQLETLEKTFKDRELEVVNIINKEDKTQIYLLNLI